MNPSGKSTSLSSFSKPNFIPRKSSKVLARQNLDGSLDLLRFDSGQYWFKISQSAAELWKLIDGSHTIKDIKDIIKDRHHFSSDKLDRDLAEFLEELAGEQLIESD